MHAVERTLADAGFGRLFPELRPRAAIPPFPEDLGLPGGPMDGGATPDPRQDNNRIPAGFTFFGQFLDHDVTFGRSALARPSDSASPGSLRTPALDLDSLYGAGPLAAPFLYDRNDPAKLLLTSLPNGRHDVPRNAQGTALIGDPRNDSNLILTQLHAAFASFHNRVVDTLRGEVPYRDLFVEARRLVCWHYQWMVLHEYLPLIVEPALVSDVMTRGGRHYHPTPGAFIPLEFSGAAFRFGHSQVAPTYPLAGGDVRPLFRRRGPAGTDLQGSRPLAPSLCVDWSRFFGTGLVEPLHSRRIDTRLASPLLDLPETIVEAGLSPAERSLAVRNLATSARLGLPSGQDVAVAMNVTPLTAAVLWTGLPSLIDAPAPLWWYVLREAASLADGCQLGPVGGRIVVETIVGLVDSDRRSFRHVSPGWHPTLPRRDPDSFTLLDLLHFAGHLV